MQWRWVLSGRSCEFYADEEDLLNLLARFRMLGDLKFVQIHSVPDRENEVLRDDPARLLSMARVTPEEPIRTNSFMVMEADQEVFSRQIVLKDGRGTISLVDQNQNLDAVVIALGGDAGDRTLIMSDINTTAETEKAKELHQKFKKLVVSQAKRVGFGKGSVLLMPGACRKARQGWRLARGKGWNVSTDPKITKEDLEKL
jgi:hypothetical protein